MESVSWKEFSKSVLSIHHKNCELERENEALKAIIAESERQIAELTAYIADHYEGGEQ
jgi:hypothetical protein